jgi:hypothetical protein
MADDMGKAWNDFAKKAAQSMMGSVNNEERIAFALAAQRRMREIGMVQGVPLETAGTHLGAVIGGGVTMGIPAEGWPHALMALLAGGDLSSLLVEKGCEHDVERRQYIKSVTGIALACMGNLMLSVSVESPDPATAIREYLELLAGLVGGAVMAAEGD